MDVMRTSLISNIIRSVHLKYRMLWIHKLIKKTQLLRNTRVQNQSKYNRYIAHLWLFVIFPSFMGTLKSTLHTKKQRCTSHDCMARLVVRIALQHSYLTEHIAANQ